LTQEAKKLLRGKKWQEAKAPLEKLLQLYPAQTGADNAYGLLAETHRALNETNQERQVLMKLASLDADALDAYLRLMELGSFAQDWVAVTENAERFLAVNPLLLPPYLYLGKASEERGETNRAIQAFKAMLRLDPPD